MKRRAFLRGAVAGAGLAAVSNLRSYSAESSMEGKREFYELRAYRLTDPVKHEALDGYLEKGAIPALNRVGAKPVGAFTEIEPKENPSLYLLIPYPSQETFLQAAGVLANDKELRAASEDELNTPKAKPAFKRIDSWFLLAFSGMPKLELPAYSKEKKGRIFELRTYESYSEEKALKKIEMFNSGEIDVMREVGLAPVFYGQALIGSNLPHLTYMLSAENRDEHKKHWGGFGQNAAWKKISGDPKYADTVSRITSLYLEPTAYSQI